MNKYGIIGCGNIGSMLIEGFIESGILEPDNLVISNRTRSKLDYYKRMWPDINISENNKKLAKECKYIFICVEPLDVKEILEEIKENFSSQKYLISVAAGISLNDIEMILPGRVKATKVIPSITSQTKIGISLMCHNDNVEAKEKQLIDNLFNTISSVNYIEEKHFEAAADVTNPGFIAAIFQNFIEARIKNNDLKREEVENMIITTLFGTAKILYENKISLNEVISQVATKGGITEEGIKVLNKELTPVFDKVFEKTIKKHNKIKEDIRKQ